MENKSTTNSSIALGSTSSQPSGSISSQLSAISSSNSENETQHSPAQQLLLLQQKQKSLPRSTRDIVFLAVNSGEIEEIEGTTFVSIWDQSKDTRSLSDGQAKFMSKLREKLGPRAEKVYLSIRKRMKEAAETLEKMRVQYKLYQLQQKQKQIEEEKLKVSNDNNLLSFSSDTSISSIKNLSSLNSNNVQMKQNSSSEVISSLSIEKNNSINSNIVTNNNVINNLNKVPTSSSININSNSIVTPKKIIFESISENIMDGYKLTDLSKNIDKQKGIILDIKAAEILSKGIQLHIKNILEESISCSKQRRNIAGLQSYNKAVDTLKLGSGILLPESKSNMIALGWGPDPYDLLKNEEYESKKKLSENYLKEEDRMRKDFNVPKDIIVDNNRKRKADKNSDSDLSISQREINAEKSGELTWFECATSQIREEVSIKFELGIHSQSKNKKQKFKKEARALALLKESGNQTGDIDYIKKLNGNILDSNPIITIKSGQNVDILINTSLNKTEPWKNQSCPFHLYNNINNNKDKNIIMSSDVKNALKLSTNNKHLDSVFSIEKAKFGLPPTSTSSSLFSNMKKIY